MLRIDLLLAMNRQSEARAFAAEAESDLAALQTEGRQEFRIGAALNRLVALGRDEAARRVAAEMSASALKELDRGNRASNLRSRFIRAEIALGNRDVAIAALDQWRREIHLVRNDFQRLQEFTGRAAHLFACLGQADEAIALLQEFATGGLQLPMSLRYDPEFAPIRSDPRFEELMRQQEAWAKAQPDPVDP